MEPYPHRIPTPAEDPALWANRDGQIIRASVVLVLLPTVFVALRLCSRWKAGAGFWWDDLSVVLAMMFSWSLSVINLLASRTAFGHHAAVLSMADFESFFKNNFAFQILYSLSMACVKFSVVLFLYRIFPIVSFRRVVMACGAFVLAFGFSSTMVFIFICNPVQDFWRKPGGPYGSEAHCISIRDWLLVNGSMNTVTNFCLILLPLPLLWRLRASTLQKCVLTGIFISGLTVTAVSMVRLIVLGHYRGRDFTFDIVTPILWTTAEPSIAVVTACLPSLRPLFAHIFPTAAHRPSHAQDDTFGSTNNLTSTWPSATWPSGSQLHDSSIRSLSGEGKTAAAWENRVDVYGGKVSLGAEEDSLELGNPKEMDIPSNRIRADTTITLTISDRIGWQDHLF